MNESEKKSQRIYLWLRSYIDENKFSNHTKIPSENTLSRHLNVSRETVRDALDRLSAEGLIYRVKGSGTYINKEAAISSEMGEVGGLRKIGLILQGQDGSANASLINGIRSVLPAEEVDLRIFLTDNKFVNERRCLQTVMHQVFHGFIVDGVKASIMNPNLDCYKQIYQKRIPVIFYNNYYKELKYPRVICDDSKCADRLLRLLLKAGHRHIAGIFFYDNYQAVEKFQGMAAAMRRYGAELQDDYVKWCVSNDVQDPRFSRQIDWFLRKLPKCTAIVCSNYIIYRIVKQVLKENGKRVPEDYSLVCFDYSENDWEKENITCSVHQGYRIGQAVATSLMAMIENGNCMDKGYSRVLDPVIHTGGSIAQIKIHQKNVRIL